jgi:integrase
MRNQTKVHLYLDVRKKLTNNHHPITIVVNHLGKRKFYRTRYSTTKDYFEKASTAKRGQSADDWDLWRKQEKKAKDIIDTIPYFNWERFERLFKSTGKINIKSYFEARIKKLLEQNRAGTARSYQAAINSLTEFQSEIIFSDITPDWLEKYETWMEGKGKSITTIGIYCRNLRAIFNQAIKDGFIDKVFYPFNDYIIPNEESRKKALSLSHLTKLKEYNPLPNEDFYIGLWWFSFYGSGMNLKDILGLKWIDIKDGRMEFYRKKTRRTRKANLKKVSVPMDEYHEQFINRFGCYDKEYIFYLYNENTNSLTRHLRVDQLNKMINKKIRKAAEAVELGIDVTLYSARHAFASLLNEKNVPLSYIKEQLGHTDIKTTQRYLDSIDKTKEKVYRSYLKVS